MALLAQDRLVKTAQMDNVQGGIIIDYAVIADDIIYKGAMLEIIAAGHVGPLSSGTDVDFAGLALEKVDNSGGSAGDKTVKTLVGGYLVDNVASATIASIGDICYAADDQTLTVVGTNNQAVGWIVQFVSGTECIVKMKIPGQPIS